MLSYAYWYCGLIVISLILTAISLLYKRDWKLLVFQLNIAAMIQPFEIVVLILLDAYRYLPGFLPEPRMDNYLGAYVSNSLILPAATAAINAFSLSWGSALLIATAFAVIDWYFTTLGIYVHIWWTSMDTWIVLNILFAVSRRVWAGLQQESPSVSFRLFIIFLTYVPIHNLIVFLTNQGGRLFRLQIPWLGDGEKVHQSLHYIHLLATGIIVSLLLGLKLRFRYRLAGIGVLVLLNWSIGYFDVFVPRAAWVSPLLLLLVSAVALPVVIVLFRAAKLDYLFP